MSDLIKPTTWLVVGAVVAFFWAVMQVIALISGTFSGTHAPEISFGSGSSSATVAYEYGQMMETTYVSFELIEASKRVNGAVAYWEANSDGTSCFFGVDTGISWAATSLPGACPSSPGDEARIAELQSGLWENLRNEAGRTWADLLAMGGRAQQHVQAIIDLARAYGVILVP